MNLDIYKTFINSLPIPTLLAKAEADGNHSTLYVSPLFEKEFGFRLDEIPDKKTWFERAYPDKVYRGAVERQWEFEYEMAANQEQAQVCTEVLITNKLGQEKRYRVATNLDAPIMDSVYQVFFINLEG